MLSIDNVCNCATKMIRVILNEVQAKLIILL